MRLLPVFIILLLAMIGAAVAVPLPDGGIRRRLDGCWVFADPAIQMCFDGVDRVELRENASVASGTYTVFLGRVMFDMSSDDNPPRENYPSCAVEIGLEHTPAVDFHGCANWQLMRLRASQSGNLRLHGKRLTNTWLASERYAGRAESQIGGPLKGCWNALRSREREQMVQDGIARFGGYLSAYSICFSGNRRGHTSSVSVDGDDGWDSAGTFLFIDGRLVLRGDFPANGETRCAIALDASSLKIFDCANWNRGPGGRMVPVHAEEPVTFEREEKP